MKKKQQHLDTKQELPGTDDIAKLAHELWEKDGKPEGTELHHWLQAESKLMAELMAKEKQNQS